MLIPRTLPASGGVTTIHKEILRDVYAFRQLLHGAKAELPEELNMAPASESVQKFVEVTKRIQKYSRAIQVFALLSVEAFLNEYGYIC